MNPMDLTPENRKVIQALVDSETVNLAQCGQLKGFMARKRVAATLSPKVSPQVLRRFLDGAELGEAMAAEQAAVQAAAAKKAVKAARQAHGHEAPTTARQAIQARLDDRSFEMVINGRKVIATRGSAHVPSTGTRITKYGELRAFLLKMRPGDASLVLQFSSRAEGRAAQNASSGVSSKPRGSTNATGGTRLPWPFATVTRWTPADPNKPDGAGTVEFWVISREGGAAK